MNPDLLEVKGGLLDTFGNNKVDLAAVTRPIAAPWDVERYSGDQAGAWSARAALLARRSHSGFGEAQTFPPAQIAKIIHSGPPKTSITYEPVVPKDMVEAIHSLPYFLATELQIVTLTGATLRSRRCGVRRSRGLLASWSMSRCLRTCVTTGIGAAR